MSSDHSEYNLWNPDYVFLWKPEYAFDYGNCFDVDAKGGTLNYALYHTARSLLHKDHKDRTFWTNLHWDETNLNKNNDFLRRLAGPYGKVILTMHLQQLEEEKKLEEEKNKST